jgi:hypothetical protein
MRRSAAPGKLAALHVSIAGGILAGGGSGRSDATEGSQFPAI